MDRPLHIAVCEDNATDAARLLDCIGQSGGAWNKPAVFRSGEALLRAFAPGRYDLIFLDIYMEGMRGIDAAAKIREADPTVTLAFTTTSTEHTLESYRLKALGYLEKPVSARDVRELLTLAENRRESAPAITLLIEGEYRRLLLDGILYFELKNHAVTVNTLTGALRASQTVKLSQIEKVLPPDAFLRCHHSYIANLRYVCEVDRALKTFAMQNGDRVYIRHASLGKAVKAYEDYLFRAVREGGV